MPDLELQLREHADRVLADVPPVTADEARQRGGRPRRRLLALAAALVLLVATASAVVVARGDDTQDVRAVGAGPQPLTLDGHRDWMLAVMNRRFDLTTAEVQRRFTAEFLRAVPQSELREVTAEVAEAGPWRVLREVERRDGDTLAVQLVADGAEQARLTLHLAADGRVDGMTVLLAQPCGPRVETDEVTLSAPLDDQLAWLMELLVSTRAPGDNELRARLAPSFLDEVSPQQFRVATAQLQRLAPYTLRFFEGSPTASLLTARVGLRTGEEARLRLSVEDPPTHRITGAAIRTQPPCTLPVP